MYLKVHLSSESDSKWIDLTKNPNLDKILKELGVNEGDDVDISDIDTDIDFDFSFIELEDIPSIIDIFNNIVADNLENDFKKLLQLGLDFNDTYYKMLEGSYYIFEANDIYDIGVYMVNNNHWNHKRDDIPEDVYESLDFEKIGEEYYNSWECDFINGECVALS